MNKQIQEIADQAGAKFSFGGFVNYDQFDCEKFAELIVKECCDVVLRPYNETRLSISMDLCKFSTRQAIDRAAQSGGLKVYTQGIAKDIQKHLGVEE